MRIGLSTSVIQRGHTGIASYLFALLEAMLRAPGENHFTLFVLEEDEPLFGFAAGRVELVRVPERYRPSLRNIYWHQRILPGLVRDLGIEVLHVPSYRRLLWARPCPLVGTIHDLAPFRVPLKYDKARMFYGRVIVKHLARRQDALIAVSHNTAADMAHFFQTHPSRVSVIHNGLDHRRFFPGYTDEARGRVAARFGLSTPFFLYIARLEHPGKNHLRLIEAFNRCKAATRSAWQLVLAGSDWMGAGAIHSAIQRSSFRKDIRCLGFVPLDDLPDLYRAAGVFVYPSLYEGFGLPTLEAMASGCPVISSTRGALREVVGDAAALIDPEDVLDLAARLQWLSQDPSAREKLRIEGLAQARRFDWNVTARQTLQVFEKVLYGRTRSVQEPATLQFD